MRILKFEPGVCLPSKGEDGSGVPPLYSGTITLKLPTNLERVEFIDGLDREGAAKDEKVARAVMRQMFDRAAAWVLEVDLKRLADGAEFKSFEDLDYDLPLLNAQMEVAYRISGDFQVVKRDEETGEPTVAAGTLGN